MHMCELEEELEWLEKHNENSISEAFEATQKGMLTKELSSIGNSQ